MIKYIKKLFNIPIWEIKCWGKAWHCFNNEYINKSILEVNEGWQCSIHQHNNRWNCFINIDSIIGVEQFDNGLKLTKTTILNPGESIIIKPKILHRFYVIKSGKIIEIYWTTNSIKCDMNDINRFDTGGRRII